MLYFLIIIVISVIAISELCAHTCNYQYKIVFADILLVLCIAAATYPYLSAMLVFGYYFLGLVEVACSDVHFLFSINQK
jgi:hypothetical protein